MDPATGLKAPLGRKVIDKAGILGWDWDFGRDDCFDRPDRLGEDRRSFEIGE